MPTRPQLVDLRDSSYEQRIGALADRVGWNIYGLVRRNALARTTLLTQSKLYWDILLSYELAGIGPFALVNTEQPFLFRFIEKSPAVVASSLTLQTTHPKHWMTEMFVDAATAVATSPLSLRERQHAVARFVATCAVHNEWWQGISSEQRWHNAESTATRTELLLALLNSFPEPAIR